MKRLIPILLLPILSLTAATVDDLTFRQINEGTAYEVSDCKSSASGTLTIPATHNGLPVTSIGEFAFTGCTSLTSITLPDSVTSIENFAFTDCTSLASITIPDSVTSIGGNAFNYCTSLTSITIPDSVTSIEYGAFYYCTSLTSITIPDAVTSIGDGAFYNCTSLTSITIPDAVTSIGDEAFSNCTRLTSITLPESLTSIGNGAFENCRSLTSITLPESLTSIGEYAFTGCTSLTSITLPNSLTSIGIYAFDNCTSLTSITSLATNAPALSSDAFLDIPASAIAVPENSTGYGTSYGGLAVAYVSNDTFAAARTAGQQDVVNDPASFDLFTASQIMDARPAAARIDVSGGKARITMTLEETSDLSDWSTPTKTDHTIEIDAPAQARFYRFKMQE